MAAITPTATPLTLQIASFDSTQVLDTIVAIAELLQLPLGNDIELELAEDKIILTSTQIIFGVEVESIFEVVVSAENGSPAITLTRATINNEALPPESIAEIESGIQTGFEQALMAQLDYTFIESIEVIDGQMTVTYR